MPLFASSASLLRVATRLALQKRPLHLSKPTLRRKSEFREAWVDGTAHMDRKVVWLPYRLIAFLTVVYYNWVLFHPGV